MNQNCYPSSSDLLLCRNCESAAASHGSSLVLDAAAHRQPSSAALIQPCSSLAFDSSLCRNACPRLQIQQRRRPSTRISHAICGLPRVTRTARLDRRAPPTVLEAALRRAAVHVEQLFALSPLSPVSAGAIVKTVSSGLSPLSLVSGGPPQNRFTDHCPGTVAPLSSLSRGQ